jgi:hypothetical protein
MGRHKKNIDGVSIENSSGPEFYLLNNESSKVIKVNNVRLMVGINIINQNQLDSLNSSIYFQKYFDENKVGAKFSWVDEFGPNDHAGKDITDLSLQKFKKVIKQIFAIDVLKQLEIDCDDTKYRDEVREQMKFVLPSSEELNKKAS